NAGHLYGDHAARREFGTAVTPFGNGFVVAGLSESDPQGVGDPRDVYLVGTDGAGKTGCEQPWLPQQVPVGFDARRFLPEPVSFLQQVFVGVTPKVQFTEFESCL